MKLPDLELAKHMRRIKREKSPTPSTSNCLDFSLGGSGYGVRVIVTYEDDEWLVSTSIGWLKPEIYTPLLTSRWTAPLRRCATVAVDEVLAHFDIDESTKRAQQSTTIVMFRFKEKLSDGHTSG